MPRDLPWSGRGRRWERRIGLAQRRENFGEVEGIEIVEAVAAAEAQRILDQPRRCAARMGILRVGVACGR